MKVIRRVALLLLLLLRRRRPSQTALRRGAVARVRIPVAVADEAESIPIRRVSR